MCATFWDFVFCLDFLLLMFMFIVSCHCSHLLYLLYDVPLCVIILCSFTFLLMNIEVCARIFTLVNRLAIRGYLYTHVAVCKILLCVHSCIFWKPVLLYSMLGNIHGNHSEDKSSVLLIFV